MHDGADATKLLLAGADVAMVASAVLLHGPQRIASILAGMTEWMDEREYVSVDQLRGSVSQSSVPDPDVYERANYYQILHSWRS